MYVCSPKDVNKTIHVGRPTQAFTHTHIVNLNTAIEVPCLNVTASQVTLPEIKDTRDIRVVPV